jgi:hypothetical protein
METIVTQIIDNWKNMSSEDFDEYMQNQQRTLLREEMEQIIDAWDNGSKGGTIPAHTFETAKEYYLENYKY